MSKLSKVVARMVKENELHPDEVVKNFMGGESYVLNPLDTLKMVAASSIFGEPSYYRKDVKDGKFSWERNFSDSIFRSFYEDMNNKSTTEIFTETIDKALDYDFGKTLELATELRHQYYMRLNPQVIMVRAAIHPKREQWCAENPGKFNEIEQRVMSRADEPMSQLAYFMYLNGGKKNNIPTILKKAVAKKLSSLDAYAVNKYKNHEIGMINAVRISHANSDVINELMKTGTVAVSEDKETWEQMKSAGATWTDILQKIKLGHMALLRNLRNIFTEISDTEVCKAALEELKEGVVKGKQFPFRYYSAYKMIEQDTEVYHKAMILDALEECIDISIQNMPHLSGKTICLSDNSGSAWGTFNSEYGKVTIAEIDNLSSVITAMASDEGSVGKFGDTLKIFDITKRNGALKQAKEITKDQYHDVGGSTEGGIWEFFRDAIEGGIVYDNIVIYSDMQAGTGGLYGTDDHMRQYMHDYGIGRHINVFALVQEYRKKVNPKVNVYSVQTAGYNNVLLPQNSYRCSMLTGWTGKEATYMDAMNKLWDELDNKQKNK